LTQQLVLEKLFTNLQALALSLLVLLVRARFLLLVEVEVQRLLLQCLEPQVGQVLVAIYTQLLHFLALEL
jgi:hypothetical protein